MAGRLAERLLDSLIADRVLDNDSSREGGHGSSERIGTTVLRSYHRRFVEDIQ